MLPQVIDERQIFTFKFWFGDQIRMGMHFQNELFCQIGVFDISQRSQVYQRVSKLAQQGVMLVITCSEQHCRIWGSLREEAIKQLLTNSVNLQLNDLMTDLSVDLHSSNRYS